ncbi:MAG: hypothetical protein ACI9WC_001366 [Arenicella sp.]|jgi:hypothetical protein
MLLVILAAMVHSSSFSNLFAVAAYCAHLTCFQINPQERATGQSFGAGAKRKCFPW